MPKILAAKALDRAFPPRQPDSPLSFSILAESEVVRVVDLLNSAARSGATPLLRLWTPDDFRLRACNSRYAVLGLHLPDSDALLGAAWGYVNPVCQGESAYFALDGVVFAHDATWKQRRALMAGVEHHARQELGCFSVVVPGNVSTMPLSTMGYIPYTQQLLSFAPLNDSLDSLPDPFGACWTELR